MFFSFQLFDCIGPVFLICDISFLKSFFIGLELINWPLVLPKSSYIYLYLPLIKASLVVQLVKNPPAMQETLVQTLGREDPLEKG